MVKPRIQASIRQEVTWVLYPLANSQSYVAGVARYAFNQSCSCRGLIGLQWLMVAADAARHVYVASKDWDNADRAQALYKRCRRVESRTVWRARDREEKLTKMLTRSEDLPG